MEIYPLMETMIYFYGPYQHNGDQLAVMFHYLMITNKFRVQDTNNITATHEILNLARTGNSLFMAYTKHDNKIKTNHDITDGVYSIYMQVNNEIFLGEFKIHEYVNNGSVTNVVGFVLESMNIINDLETYITTGQRHEQGSNQQYAAPPAASNQQYIAPPAASLAAGNTGYNYPQGPVNNQYAVQQAGDD
ncbi:unnamed protein product [Rotaria sp. Silwood2]|nr:unnamed protein product [Rotaria sp. Silwood2]CAF3382351.1 unnamed protein product [Rotaria sp. Silwood2]CAF3987788.1 unnamed protein product [Rotaria sp. Silwood2]CAF4367812.1 unnamed protein product [Rotaria sp. Silwood2]